MCHCILVYCIEMVAWYWNVYWYEDSWFCVVKMVHGVVALQEGYGIITYDIQRIDWWEVFMRYMHYQLIYCLCVLWWKSLKPSRKTFQCGCMGLVLPLGFSPWRQVGMPLGMSPKRHGVWLALGWCPKIVIIILIEYLVEQIYLMCRLVGVSSLWLLKGWMRKSKDETSKHIHTCLTWLHIC